MSDPVDPILQYFRYDHLSEPLQKISKIFADAAAAIILLCPRNPERSVALRKILESRDCAIRAVS